ncbi:MAG: hypothetical protein LPK03_04880 [Pontibacter sp.]|nr:hypothetical protein [Pontibacter sp.]
MQLYFKNSFVTLSYDQAARLGKAVWRGRLQGPELREAFLLCLEMINRFGLTCWLADDRLMDSIEPTDLEWCLEVYIPRIAGSSILRFARLPSKFEENLHAVGIMIDKGHSYDLKLALRDFTSEQEAMEWLQECG